MKSLFAEEYQLFRQTLGRARTRWEKESAGNPLQDTVPLGDVLHATQLHEVLADDNGPAPIDGVCWAAVFEELGPTAVGPQLLAHLGLAAVALRQLAPRSDLARQYLDATLAAHLAPALAVQEADPAGWQGRFATTCQPAGAGLELTGTKTSVIGLSDCDVLLVMACQDGHPNLLAVDVNAPGLDITNGDSLDPALALSALRFRSTPATALAAPHPSTWAQLSQALDWARLAVAAMCLGSAQQVLTLTVSYAELRNAFGHPISHYQAVSHRCADMHVSVEQMRAMTYRACLDAESDDTLEFAHSACLAKLVATQGYARLAADAIRIQSGIGITWENPLSSHYRRAYWARSLLGGPALERNRAAQLAVDAVHQRR
jgi:acyl-CoA dehydrogenase